MAKRRRRSSRWPRRILLALLAIPLALSRAPRWSAASIPVNRGWREPDKGITIYLADNGVHADLILPVRAAGLDWAPLVPRSDMADARPDMQLDRVRRGRAAGLSRHPDLGRHQPAHRAGRRPPAASA